MCPRGPRLRDEPGCACRLTELPKIKHPVPRLEFVFLTSLFLVWFLFPPSSLNDGTISFGVIVSVCPLKAVLWFSLDSPQFQLSLPLSQVHASSHSGTCSLLPFELDDDPFM